MSGGVAVGMAIGGCLVALVALVVLTTPVWIADRQRAAVRRRIGLADLSQREVEQAIVWLGAGLRPDEVRGRVLGRRAAAELLRRRGQLRGRERTGQAARAARSRKR